MAQLPISYNDGTASVTAGDVAVTGQGTTWLTSGIQAGDRFWAAGADVRIASVDSNTQLTLAYPWPGATRAGASYEIIFATIAERVSATTLAVLNALGNGNLFSIGKLASAADTMPYFTGEGVAGLASLKAKGRDIIGSDTTLTLLAKLGPVLGGNNMPRPATADVGMADGDFNTIKVSGTYTITGNWANGPAFFSAAPQGVLEVAARFDGANLMFQRLTVASPANGGVTARRQSADGGATWSPWMACDGAILGSVSQINGGPTGAIIERGTNANGDYIRFADGTQICISPPLSINIATAAGPLFRANGITAAFPANFVAGTSPGGFGSLITTVNGWLNPRCSTTAWIAEAYSYATRGTTVDTVTLGAIGRWF